MSKISTENQKVRVNFINFCVKRGKIIPKVRDFLINKIILVKNYENQFKSEGFNRFLNI